MTRCVSRSFLWLLTLLSASLALDKPDISWGDWIIIDDSAQADSGASILLRRITPKSVFVAPNFNNCPEGYRQDALGRCVKVVQVNKQAQWNFFLEKLNSMYAPTPSQGKKESGPFHVNLPIGSSVREEPPLPVRHTTPVSTTLLDTDIPSTIEDLISTVKVDRDTQEKLNVPSKKMEHTTTDVEETTRYEQDTTPQTELQTTTRRTDQETTKIETTIVKNNEEETTNVNDKQDEDTTKSIKYEETTNESMNTEKYQDTTTESMSKETESVQQTQTVPKEMFEEEEAISEETSENIKKPFIIVVTGRPEAATEVSDFVSEASATSDVTESETVEPIKVKFPSVQCGIDCEQGQSVVAPPEGKLTPPLSDDRLEPVSQVRFPSESNVPVRKTSFRFPDERRGYRWSSWEYRHRPDVVAWPTSYHYTPQSSIHHTQSWSNSPPWHRRIIQRD